MSVLYSLHAACVKLTAIHWHVDVSRAWSQTCRLDRLLFPQARGLTSNTKSLGFGSAVGNLDPSLRIIGMVARWMCGIGLSELSRKLREAVRDAR
ncbi:hypothetical protein ARMSODRAFT_58274 [Armillaria solidipes]|uniref:Uncharacterized protein n=1 Tax=Armillaria solidipes TaxID=1076256 RepID=A0A2H3C707_9AGAR|nr:hypothetical protein ARMSODRAFT_58274 [Armillaria solidipes]